MEIRKISRHRPRSVDDAELGHFQLHFTLLFRTKSYNAHAQLLFCSLIIKTFCLVIADVLVVFVVVVCLSFQLVLIISEQKYLDLETCPERRTLPIHILFGGVLTVVAFAVC